MSDRAAPTKPSSLLRAALTAVAAVLFAIGWVVGVLWFVVTWLAAAVRVGFVEGARR